MSAGKIEKLQELLPRLKANGDRVLLFSQFTQILDILEVVLDTMNIRYLKLTGQTSVTERQGLVDQYTNDPDITVFRTFFFRYLVPELCADRTVFSFSPVYTSWRSWT